MTTQTNPSPGAGPGDISSQGTAAPVITGDGHVQYKGKVFFWDDLDKADQEKVIEYYISAQIPLLPFPIIQAAQSSSGSDQSSGVTGVSSTSNSPTQTVGHASYEVYQQQQNVNSAAIQMVANQQLHKIILNMLDAWVTSNQEIAEQNKEAARKRETIESAKRAYEIQQDRTQDSSEKFMIAFTMGVILAGSALAQGLAVNPTTNIVVANPVVSMSNTAIPPVFGDIRTQLGLINGIFATGVMYGSAAEVAAKATGKGGKLAGPDFAIAYGKNIQEMVKSNGFTSYLTSIVAHEGQKIGQTQEQITQLVSMMKMVLLSSAMALIYQSTAGKMTSIEYASMIKGTLKYKENDTVLQQLAEDASSELKLLSPHHKETILAALLDFFDTNPSMEVLENPGKVFSALFPTFHHPEMAG